MQSAPTCKIFFIFKEGGIPQTPIAFWDASLHISYPPKKVPKMEKKVAKTPPICREKIFSRGWAPTPPPTCAMVRGGGVARVGSRSLPGKKNNSLYSGTFLYLFHMYVGGAFLLRFSLFGGGGIFHHVRAFFATFFPLWGPFYHVRAFLLLFSYYDEVFLGFSPPYKNV